MSVLLAALLLQGAAVPDRVLPGVETISCDTVAWPESRRLSEAALSKLEFTAVQLSFGISGEIQKKVAVQPHVGIELPHGRLLGSNRGEWGGELAFQRADGSTDVLLEVNVVAILPTQVGAVVVTGLSHGGVSQGAIFNVRSNGSDRPIVGLAHVLETAPDGVWQLRDGSALIRTAGALRASEGGLSLDRAWYRLRLHGPLTHVSCEDGTAPSSGG